MKRAEFLLFFYYNERRKPQGPETREGKADIRNIIILLVEDNEGIILGLEYLLPFCIMEYSVRKADGKNTIETIQNESIKRKNFRQNFQIIVSFSN